MGFIGCFQKISVCFPEDLGLNPRSRHGVFSLHRFEPIHGTLRLGYPASDAAVRGYLAVISTPIARASNIEFKYLLPVFAE